MRRAMALTLLAMALLATACGTDAATEESAAAAPTEPDALVAALFDRLAAGEFEATASMVDESQLAILTAIEGASPTEVAGMLERGLPAQVRADFWEGFVESLPLMVDESVERAEVGTVEDLGGGFYAVAVTFPGAERPAHWIVRDGATGRRVDLFATFGPAFAPNLVDWYQRTPEGPARDAITAALRAGADSLRLGLEQEPLGPWGDPARTGVADLLTALTA